LVPRGDLSGILESVNQNSQEYCIFFLVGEEQWDVGRTFHAIMIVEGGSHTRVRSSHGYILVAAVRAWLSLLEVWIMRLR
jgi:hypothetical protein